MTPRGQTTRRPAVALLVALAACSTGTEPSADLSGPWEYTFATLAPVEACPNAPPGFRAGCGGAGVLTLAQDDTRLTGTLTFSGSCQDCGTVADYRDARRAVTGRWLGDDQIELSIEDCGHLATVPSGMPEEVSGSVTCAFGGIQSRGDWTMAR